MANSEPRTTLDLVKLTAAWFAEKGIESPRLEAEVLLAHLLGVTRIGLYLQFDKPLDQREVEGYRELVRRRARGEPTAYIVGSREFWSLPFKVAPGVLIPRPDTELLVEMALSFPGEALRVAEVGVGSGAVIVSILSDRKGWSGLGTDVSPEALAVAAENAAANGVADRLALFAGDLLAPLAGQRFNLVISNPPYIPSAEIPALAVEVAAHEPRLALDGGPDGLDVVRRLASETPEYLAPGGSLLLEYGLGQEEPVRAILAATGAYEEIRIFSDLTGRPRAAAAKVPGE